MTDPACTRRWLKRGVVLLSVMYPVQAFAQTAFSANSSDVVRAGAIIAVLAVLPTLLIAMTGFTRIVIVLSMIRHAFGMPETPPNAVLVSLALFLTIIAMGPVAHEISGNAVQPYLSGQLPLDVALDRSAAPLRRFMLAQTKDSDLRAMYRVSRAPLPTRPEQVEMLKLVPAFMINELRVAFTIGFVILLPFLLIDLVVSAILLAMGMMMVPPTTIALPIKILMFVLIDGWSLVIVGVLGSFH